MMSKRTWTVAGLMASVVVAASMTVAADVRTRVPTQAHTQAHLQAHIQAIDKAYLVDFLSGIDFIPEPEDLGIGSDELISIARGHDPDTRDPGMRVRAYSALAWYGTDNEADLLDAITEYDVFPLNGESFVYLRAAIETLAQVAGPSMDMSDGYAAGTLASLLDHGNRDIRVAAARALGTYGSRADNLTLAEQIRTRLENRLAIEEVSQVRTAIQGALGHIDAAPDAEQR